MASEVSSGTTTNQGGEKKTRLELPPGFRCQPTDQELVANYFEYKVFNSSVSGLVSADVDLNKIEPWDLPSNAMRGEEGWYFFSRKDRKYPSERATGSGYWKATGKDKEIFRGHRVLLGMKKTLVSYKGRQPIEHQTGGDVSTGDMRIAADDGRLGKGDQDDPGQFRIIIPPARRRLLLELCKSQWDPADDDGFNMATPKEEDPLHCSLRAPKPSVRFPTSDALHNKVPWDTEVLSIVGNALWYTRQLAVNKIMTGNLIQRHDKINHEADINGNIKIFTEVEIERITRNFSTLIGKGGFGEVYRGILDDDNEPVAVKKYINEDLREVFVEEVRPRKISHKNVVKGYCIGEHTLMIVMEYMSKGNLNDILHHSEISIPLDVRLGIAIGCAEALSYMHSMHLSSGNLVCHGDVKPANILLDDNLTAKLTDFGVSRLLVGGITRYTTTTKGSIEYMDPIYIQEGCPTRLEIARDMAPALVFLHSSLDRHSIVHRDLKADNILLDEKVEPMISDFGLSRVLHADDYTHIPTGRAVHAHNGPLDAKFSGKPSAKRGIETSIVSHVNRRPRYLSVHHHPFTQILPSARKWITSKRTFGDIFKGGISAKPKYESFGDIFKGWISDKPKYETPIVGPVSEYIIRKLFGIKNGLTVNGSQQHSDPDYSRPDHGKMAVNTQTSTSWIIATAAPHHATGNRNLLSGFIMEHDDQFVHAVNRVPMKVLARGAVVTDALILPDVWFVPGLTENLVSVSQLAELDHSIGFGRGECCIRSARDAKIVGKGRLQKGGHYVLDYLKVPLAI